MFCSRTFVKRKIWWQREMCIHFQATGHSSWYNLSYSCHNLYTQYLAILSCSCLLLSRWASEQVQVWGDLNSTQLVTRATRNAMTRPEFRWLVTYLHQLPSSHNKSLNTYTHYLFRTNRAGGSGAQFIYQPSQPTIPSPLTQCLHTLIKATVIMFHLRAALRTTIEKKRLKLTAAFVCVTQHARVARWLSAECVALARRGQQRTVTFPHIAIHP
jgi:hypothetical protein